jgi:tRNA (guanine-N1)-methyltransferase
MRISSSFADIIKEWINGAWSFITKEISIDYVLSGGELGALVLSDALIRLIQAFKWWNLALTDSFQDGLSGPIYIDLQITKDGKFLRF